MGNISSTWGSSGFIQGDYDVGNYCLLKNIFLIVSDDLFPYEIGWANTDIGIASNAITDF
jgi:hypothetical protein